jgi:hypothetical protein
MDSNSHPASIRRICAQLLGSTTVIASVSLLAPMAECIPQGLHTELTVETRDDLYRPTPGVAVEVSFPGSTLSSVTDSDGWSGPLVLPPGTTAEVVLGETPLATGGFVLGMVNTVDAMVTSDPTVNHTLQRRFSQPVALPVRFRSDVDYVSPLPFHSRWELSPVVGGERLQFAANVALLLTPEDVQGFAAYQGVVFSSPGASYKLGLFMRTPAIQFGSRSTVVSIDCAGHGFTQAPAADCYSLRGTPASSSGWDAQLLLWEDDRAHFLVRGQMPRGDNLILLRAGGAAPLPSSSLVAAPRHPSIGAGAPLASTASGPGTNCSISCVPVTSGSVTFSVPESHTGCYVATLLGSPSCETKSRPGLLDCSSIPNSNFKYKREWRFGGGVSARFNLRILGQDVPVTASGSYSFTSSHEWFVPIEAGVGCGQCVMECHDLTLCASGYRTFRNRFAWLWNPENPEWPFPYQTRLDCQEEVGTTTTSIEGRTLLYCDRPCN